MLGQGLLSWKAALLSCSRVPCGCAWKSQGRSLSLAPVRTVNRNRSPRLKASGRQNNVGKGSRQNRSVTSGKGLALRVEWFKTALLVVWAWRGLRHDPVLSGIGTAPDPSQALMTRGRACLLHGGPLPYRTTNLELERTRGIRLFN